MFCEMCGEEEAKFSVIRKNYSKTELVIKTDKIGDRCLKVYRKWETEGRIIELKVSDL